MAATPVVERDRRDEQAGIAIVEPGAHGAELTPHLVPMALTIGHVLGKVGHVVRVDPEEGDVLRRSLGVGDGAQGKADAGVVVQHWRTPRVDAQESGGRIRAQARNPAIVATTLRHPIHSGSGQHESVEEGHGQRA